MSGREITHKVRRLNQLPRPPDTESGHARTRPAVRQVGTRPGQGVNPRKYSALTRRDLDSLTHLQSLSREQRLELKAVSAVLPFRTNRYVVEELIQWDGVPEDPIYQLTFPQPGMLEEEDLSRVASLISRDAPEEEIRQEARAIQLRLNPHPADQMELNVPELDGERLQGFQHKYPETVLFFPSQGQTCHAYCTYCFRWAQFVGLEDLKFANQEAEKLVAYLKQHPEVTDVLITGGDPLVMKSALLRRYVEPLLIPELGHVTSIRIGTKAPAYWPYRFVTDPDADDLLHLFEQVQRAGRHLGLMSHYTHPREISTPVSRLALRRIRNTGAVVRCQAPIVRHVNDDPKVWQALWQDEVRLGAVPYYMFLPRNTGARAYFEIPLARALEVFRTAYRGVSGLGRTVRGPSMSTSPGKVVIDGTTRVDGEEVFVLKFLQARDPEWVGQTFFAKYDPSATWLDELQPAFGRKTFFYESGMQEMAGGIPAD